MIPTLAYPLVNQNLILGIKSRESLAALRNQYIYFTPRILDINKEQEQEDVNTLANTSRQDIKTAATPKTDKNSNPLYIALPIKGFDINLDHSYDKRDIFTGNVATAMIRNAAKTVMGNAVEAIVESEIGKLTGLDKVKNTILAEAGVSEYKPTRNLYEKTTSEGPSFKWTLSPKNKNEAIIIYKIIKLFQYLSMPKPASAVGGAGGTVLNAMSGENKFFIKNPAIWRIRFSDPDFLPPHLFRANNEFELMTLRKVGVKFGSGDLFTFIQKANEKNFPVEIDLDLSFDYYSDLGTASDFLGVSSIKEILESGF